MEYTCPRNCNLKENDGHECQVFINYLDLHMFIDEDGCIQTDLHIKPHAKCQYLRPDSSHPRHIFSNIPKSLVHRIVRICSVPGMREVRLQELKEKLLNRGYKPAMLNDAMKYGLELNREDSLRKVERENKTENRVRYTITFDPKLTPLSPILVKNWKVMLDSDQRLKKPFPAPPMACLKRGPNLAEELIRAKVPRPIKQYTTRATVVGFRSCKGGRKQCSLCPLTGAASDGMEEP